MKLNEYIVIFSGIIGLIAACISIVLGVGLKYLILLFSGILLLFLIFVLLNISKKKQKYQIIDFEKLKEVTFRPATENDITEIIKLDKQVFEKNDIVTEEVFRSWQIKNKIIFTVMYIKEKFSGYYTILPLNDKALNAFIDGYLREKDIMPKDILEENDIHYCKSIYFYSIVINRRHTKFSLVLICDAARKLENIRRRKKKLQNIYSVAATKDGDRLLRRFGFNLYVDGIDRPDKHRLYCKNLTSELNLVDVCYDAFNRFKI